MFKASPGYAIVGGDFSAQEPRLLTHLSNENTLRETFEKGRDPYATISSFVFKKDYWECMEHHEDGSPNPDGKALRSKAKSIMLGILYGMGAKLLSTILGTSLDECKEILEEFFKMFPGVKVFTESNERMAKEQGYVEDYLGRRRHLPDALLTEIEVRAKKSVLTACDVFMDCNAEDCEISIPDDELIQIWSERWSKCADSKRFNAKREFKEDAKKNGIELYDNGAFISKTLTQCTNARIQGSAATLTKKAMVNIFNDPLMNQLGFKILIPIHDELLGECPIENVEAVEKRLSQLMADSAKPECTVAMKCDTYTVKHWYADEVFNAVHDAYIQYVKGNASKGIEPITSDEAVAKLQAKYVEISPNIIVKMCEGTYDVLSEEI